MQNKLIRILSRVITIIILLFFPYFLYTEIRKNLYNSAISSLDKLPANYEIFCKPEFIAEINELQENPHISFTKLATITRKLSELDTGLDVYDYDDCYAKIYINTVNKQGGLLIKDDGYVGAQLVFLDRNNEQAIIDDVGRIKVRGNSTSEAEKKPYNIRFSKKQDLFGFGEAKKWCLLADCFDVTMLRNRIALDLAKEMELTYTPECEYVKVYMDGEYYGSYLLTESIEADKERVDIDINKGDYMIEFDAERDDNKTSYIVTDSEWRFAIKEPEGPDEETYYRIYDKVNAYDEIICTNDLELIREYIDVDSFAKMYIQ